MRPRVVLTHWAHPEVLELLGRDCDVLAPAGRDVWPAEEVRRRCRDSQAVIVCMADSLDEAFLAACPELVIVAAALKGYDNFDVAACTNRGVWFTNVPDLLTTPTAELAVALLLGLGRNLLAGDRLVRGGQFAGWRPVLYGSGLAGRTVGLVGMGALGRALARRLLAFEARLLYADPAALPADDPLNAQVSRVELAELLGQSDYVVLLAPLTADTRHLIDRDRLALCKQGAYLVNVGRGSVVDEEAVAGALTAGWPATPPTSSRWRTGRCRVACRASRMPFWRTPTGPCSRPTWARRWTPSAGTSRWRRPATCCRPCAARCRRTRSTGRSGVAWRARRSRRFASQAPLSSIVALVSREGQGCGEGWLRLPRPGLARVP
jgi:phosphonate dehydrogenase